MEVTSQYIKKNEEEEAALIHAYKMKIRTLPIKWTYRTFKSVSIPSSLGSSPDEAWMPMVLIKI